jgi:hypothetical protein
MTTTEKGLGKGDFCNARGALLVAKTSCPVPSCADSGAEGRAPVHDAIDAKLRVQQRQLDADAGLRCHPNVVATHG